MGGAVGITLMQGFEFYRRFPSTKRNSSARCAREGIRSRSSRAASTTRRRSSADLGTTTGAGTVVAIGAADVSLVRDGIEAFARRALTTIRGNLL